MLTSLTSNIDRDKKLRYAPYGLLPLLSPLRRIVAQLIAIYPDKATEIWT